MKTIFIFLSLTCVDDPGGKSVWHVGAEAEIRMEKCQEKSDWSVINQTLHEAPKLFLVNPVQAGEEGDTLGPAVPPSQQSRHNTEQWWPARGHNTELSHWISHHAMRYKPLICCCDGGQVSLRGGRVKFYEGFWAILTPISMQASEATIQLAMVTLHM